MARNAIVVISRQRSDLLMKRTLTLNWLSKSKKYPVILAVREDEEKDYEKVLIKFPYLFLMLLPQECEDSGMYRDAVLRHGLLKAVEKVAICDDDLRFGGRDWNSKKITELPYGQIDDAFDLLFHEITDETIHVGLRQRKYAQLCKNNVDEYKRIQYVHGVNRMKVLENNLTFAWKHKLMVDAYFQLSVTRAGYRTAVVNSYTVNDDSTAYGGCSVYRTEAERERSLWSLHTMFPESVRMTYRLKYKDCEQDCIPDITIRFADAKRRSN